MSEDLEAPSPTAEPVAAVAAPAAPAEPVAPLAPEPDPDEASALEVQGGKYVPLSALQAARAEGKALKEKAGHADVLAAQLQQVAPYIDFIRQNPQLLQPQRPAEPDRPPHAVDPELVELARSLDYYDKSGNPDTERAAKHASIIDQRAMRLAQQMMQPIAQNADQERSQRHYYQALQTKTPDGRAPRPETLQWMWQNLPAGYTADPRVAQVLPALALGLDAMHGGASPLPPRPAAPAGPPLVTEASGGARPRAAKPMAQLERDVIAQRGMSEQKYQELTKDFVPGRSNVLED